MALDRSAFILAFVALLAGGIALLLRRRSSDAPSTSLLRPRTREHAILCLAAALAGLGAIAFWIVRARAKVDACQTANSTDWCMDEAIGALGSWIALLTLGPIALVGAARAAIWLANPERVSRPPNG